MFSLLFDVLGVLFHVLGLLLFLTIIPLTCSDDARALRGPFCFGWHGLFIILADIARGYDLDLDSQSESACEYLSQTEG